MTDDPFASIKAILDGHARKWKDDKEHGFSQYRALTEALKQIIAIKDDPAGNGLRLAIQIAAAAVEAAEFRHWN